MSTLTHSKYSQMQSDTYAPSIGREIVDFETRVYITVELIIGKTEMKVCVTESTVWTHTHTWV